MMSEVQDMASQRILSLVINKVCANLITFSCLRVQKIKAIARMFADQLSELKCAILFGFTIQSQQSQRDLVTMRLLGLSCYPAMKPTVYDIHQLHSAGRVQWGYVNHAYPELGWLSVALSLSNGGN